MRRFLLILFFALCTFGLFYWLQAPQRSEEEPHLNVYNWYGVMPISVLKDFEKETGIKVRYDLFDSNDMLEAKILAGHSGYDVVFPSATPYLKTQIDAGAYQALDRNQLSNWNHIEPYLLALLNQVDPGNTYGVPYFWGTIGFAYVAEEILKRFPDAPVTSYRLLFDPDVVRHFADCGVTLLEEPVDVYPLVLKYLGYDPHSHDDTVLKVAHEHLQKIRPFIRRFSSSRFVNELVGGETCLAQAWSGEAQMAQDRADEAGKNVHIIYVIPEEGTSLWIDTMAVPKDAPHPRNAHKFINFLLRPEISARMSEYARLGVANRNIKAHLSSKLASDPTIYPSIAVMQKLYLDQPQSQDFERRRTRLWAQLRFERKRG